MARFFAIVCLMLASTDVLATNRQCDVDEHGLHSQEAGISLLQSKLEVVKSSEAVPEKGSIVMKALKEVEDEARAKLLAGTVEGATPDMTVPGSAFSAVMVSMPVGKPIIPRDRIEVAREWRLESKQIILSALTPPCRVYGLGVAAAASHEYPTFENDMAERGCDTHAFDCSVKVDDANVVNAPFHFHPWCIGKDTQGNSDDLKETSWVKNKSEEHLKFKSLADTMIELNHTSLDLLKFDIEGFEWSLFDDELLRGTALPRQMSFELHTEGAKPKFVSPDVVKGKGFKQVNELFLTLFDMGYRVLSKEINNGDPNCAEFVVVSEAAGDSY